MEGERNRPAPEIRPWT